MAHSTLALREDDILYVRLEYDVYVKYLANDMYFKMGAKAASSGFHFQRRVSRPP